MELRWERQARKHWVSGTFLCASTAHFMFNLFPWCYWVDMSPLSPSWAPRVPRTWVSVTGTSVTPVSHTGPGTRWVFNESLLKHLLWFGKLASHGSHSTLSCLSSVRILITLYSRCQLNWLASLLHYLEEILYITLVHIHWTKINHMNTANYRGYSKYGLDVCPGSKGNVFSWAHNICNKYLQGDH